MGTLGEISTHVINKKLILALNERWLSYFDSRNPILKVSINQNKIILTGPKILRQEPIIENAPWKEVSVFG